MTTDDVRACGLRDIPAIITVVVAVICVTEVIVVNGVVICGLQIDAEVSVV